MSCKHLTRQTTDSRMDGSGVRTRKYFCPVCSKQFRTREIEIDAPNEADPDVIDAVLAMRKIGVSYPVIAEQTGLTTKEVQKIENGA